MKNRLECMQPIRFLVVLLMCCLSYTTWAQTQSNVNGSGITYMIKGNEIILKASKVEASQQTKKTRTVTGTVIDAENGGGTASGI